MPTYDYECTKCERRFEVFQSITARTLRKLDTDCAKCNNKAPVRRLIGSGAAVLFKGSGFYQTDYRSEAYKKAAESEKKTSKDTKSDGKKSDSGEAKKSPKSGDPTGKSTSKGTDG
jgi:putative FmdB family regulatory protein